MIERGADVNAPYFNHWTALHEASHHGHKEILKFLLNKNANVFARDDEGLTPVFVACQQGRVKCLKILLQFCSSKQKKREAQTNI